MNSLNNNKNKNENNDDNNKIAINQFCNYFNKNLEFIPQINKINLEILNTLNSFKIGYNLQFIDTFYNYDNKFELKKLLEFCKKYGKKIKEITFMDNNIPNLNERKECLFILKYIIKNSNMQKIEDRYFDGDKSLFLKLLDLDYNEDIYEKEYLKSIEIQKNQRDIMDIIKDIKYYSLYFDNYYYENNIIKTFNDIILLNSKQLEELKISKINKQNSINFINLRSKY